jgi:hypothetical protein
MNTKLLMAVSASFLGLVGIALSFLPQEVANYCGLPQSSSIVLQVCGSLYFGFATLNWMAKGNLIGGIYSKPVAVANFAHFLIGGLALLKYTFPATITSYMWIPVVVYLAFAILFGYVLLFNPVPNTKAV